jgi:hypothetical protein
VLPVARALPAFAPRIPPRLLRALVRLDDPGLPYAEINRRLGAEAERLQLPRPSYERVRVLLHAARLIARRHQHQPPSTARVLYEVWARLRPPLALIDHLYGEQLRPLPP